MGQVKVPRHSISPGTKHKKHKENRATLLEAIFSPLLLFTWDARLTLGAYNRVVAKMNFAAGNVLKAVPGMQLYNYFIIFH